MSRVGKPDVVGLHQAARLTVPVLGATSGGGRTTVALLAAVGLARLAPTVVLDTAPVPSSPWRRWPLVGGEGLASIPHDQPVRTSQVQSAAVAGLDGRLQVLTDRRPWPEAPLPLPAAPAAWQSLARMGGWQVGVADTDLVLCDDLVAGRAMGSSRSAQWLLLDGAAPVLCAAASRDGLEAVAVSVAAAESERLPLQRCVLAVTGLAGGSLPRQCKAVLTMLAPRVGAVVQVPHCPDWRAHGLRDPSGLSRRFTAAADSLAAVLVDLAERSWGPMRASTPELSILSTEAMRDALTDDHAGGAAAALPPH
ncbi:hypothetical protein [Kitasatospora aburaviensis]|uniref:Uncharacterized protein n=1 Tax=Kitasatospora aburaviensis TaxID=67265 RepID=A0ABW1F480_9ACTN